MKDFIFKHLVIFDCDLIQFHFWKLLKLEPKTELNQIYPRIRIYQEKISLLVTLSPF